MKKLQLKLLPNEYSIYKLTKKSKIPTFLYKMNSFFSFTSTEEETSLICDSNFKIDFSLKDDNWSCIQLVGQLNVEETGIWSRITNVCSDCNCAVLTVTTFNTDFFLVKTPHLEKLKSRFLEKNFTFVK